MKKVLIISPHFAPTNAPDMQRARLAIPYLRAHGWEPVVLAIAPEYIEGGVLDPLLEATYPADTRIVRVRGIPPRLTRWLGIGSLWLRCGRAFRAAGEKLLREEKFDLVFFTTTQFDAFTLGPLWKRQFGLPYVLDYQDPWVNRWPGIEVPLSRAWGSYHLSSILEPWSVRGASLITGMAPGYVAGMLERNPEVAEHAVIACMPMGIAPEDYKLVRELDRPPFLFQPGDGRFHMIYAGALLPAGIVVLDCFLGGLRELKVRSPDAAGRLKVHFVGTGSSPDDPRGHQVRPRAQQMGVDDMVDEHPQRIGYVDALNHLTRSDAVLVLGSTEAHYTPSKVFQAMLSRRPVFALLHKDSTAVDMIRSMGAGNVVTLTETALPGPAEVAGALRALMADTSSRARS